MKLKTGVMCLILGSLAAVTVAANSQEVDKVFPSNPVREQAITAQVKLQFSAHDSSAMNHVTIRTDSKGVVWLSGTVATQALADQAEEIARNVVGVNSVNNQIVVKTGA
jgi:osmotically-inducible protein OsmY